MIAPTYGQHTIKNFFKEISEAIVFGLYFFHYPVLGRDLCICNSYLFLETRTKGIRQTTFQANSCINSVGIDSSVDCHHIWSECIKTQWRGWSEDRGLT